jgi:hypothetical protein
MARLFLLVLALFLVAGCGEPAAPAAPATALPVAAKAPFRQVVVERQTIAAGAEQAISVTLDQRAATTTILQLTITYPGGETQDVLDQTLGSTATLNWLVPDDIRSGEARFRLKTSGCGCGDRSGTAELTDLESTVEGSFFVKN